MIKDGETAEEAAQREFFEETGRRLGDVGKPLMRSVKDVDYTTYIVDLKSEFVPVLNHEHNGYMWADPAAALEGEVIPPTPIAKGPLALIVMETKRDYGLRQRDLMVLSSGEDSFGLDTLLGHTLGRWLKVRLDLHAPFRVIHLRGVHYLLGRGAAVTPDGQPYQNPKDDLRMAQRPGGQGGALAALHRV